ncbi:hypothetical protein Ddye_020363, partial [Dipteronia dyeriana]
ITYKQATSERKMMGSFRQTLIVVATIAAAIHNQIQIVEAVDIGVCYGMLGDNLPPATDVVNLGSQIEVILGIKDEDLPNLAASPDAVASWFSINVEPYLDDIEFPVIAVGNEVIPGNYAENVLPVMLSLQNILVAKSLNAIKVSTVLSGKTLGSSYPPSSGAFTVEGRGLESYYMFDAMEDSFFSANDKEGVSVVNVLVSASGWPSAGNGDFTAPQLAATYDKNFMNHITSNRGTPKRPETCIQGFIFATFNENQKPAGVKKFFGLLLFYPNMEPVYPVFS